MPRRSSTTTARSTSWSRCSRPTAATRHSRSAPPRSRSTVPAAANRFLEMMSETCVGWLLLEAAVISEAALAKLPADHPDRAFYDGKRYAAQYFASNVLPGVATKAQMIAREDRSALDIPAA